MGIVNDMPFRCGSNINLGNISLGNIYASILYFTRARIKVSSLEREQLPIPQFARAYGKFHRDMPRKRRNPTIGNQRDFLL